MRTYRSRHRVGSVRCLQDTRGGGLGQHRRIRRRLGRSRKAGGLGGAVNAC